MASCSCSKKQPRPIIASFVSFFLIPILVSSSAGAGNGSTTAQVLLRSGDEQLRFEQMKAQLARVREASVKTIQSPDGDGIDCVPTHLQPAFDHPKLRGQKPADEPASRPRNGDAELVGFVEKALPQIWRSSSEWCPEGSIPVRRTKEGDLLRASSVGRFRMKPQSAAARRDSTSNGHEVSHRPRTASFRP